MQGCLQAGRIRKTCSRITRELAAADEVDDFVAIAGLNSGLVPLRARKDFKIAFYGHATGGKIQLLQQVRYCGAVGCFAALSIYGDC